MKKLYEIPEMEVVKFSSEDVIATSSIEDFVATMDTEDMAGLN